MATERRKLLLADDSSTIQKVVSLTFDDEGYDVTSVSDGEQALAELEKNTPDIVLADVFMPKINGYELCTRIRGDERLRHVPVLLLVGAFEPFNEEEARRVGADDFLTKPFQSIRNLVSRVGGLLSGQHEDEQPTKDSLPPIQATDIEHNQRPSETALHIEPSVDAHDSGAASVEADSYAEPLGEPSEEHFTPSMIEPAQRVYDDVSMDDEMIETTSVDEFREEHDSSFVASSPEVLDADEVHETHAEPDFPVQQIEDEPQLQEGPEEEMSIDTRDEQREGAQQFSSEDFSTRVASGAVNTDETLLDLGEIEPPRSAAEADDFILDLADDTSYESVEDLASPHSASTAAPVLEAEPVLAEEPIIEAEPVETASATAAATIAGASSVVAVAAGPVSASGASQEFRLDQLPPEAIDAIARRAVELLSEKVIREIAWEVVPDLAERLIKRRLEEERSGMR